MTIDQPPDPKSHLYADGAFTPLDVANAPITIAFGINDFSQIVGIYQEESGTHGFLATPQKK